MKNLKKALLEAIKKVRETAKKRNFVQTFDLIINLKGIDVKKPENRINEDVELPHGRGKDAKIVVFSDSFKNLECTVIGSKEIEKLGKDKRSAKKLARNTDFFLAEPQLMPLIGRSLGKILAPRGKMPRVIKGEPEKMVEKYKKCVRIRIKDAPTVQCIIGKEDMEDEKIAENAMEVINFLISKLPKGVVNIKNILIKLTMSKPVKVEV